MSSEDARAALVRIAERVAECERAHAQAVAERDAAIRQALGSGMSALDVAPLARVTRARVYQVRDARR